MHVFGLREKTWEHKKTIRAPPKKVPGQEATFLLRRRPKPLHHCLFVFLKYPNKPTTYYQFKMAANSYNQT